MMIILQFVAGDDLCSDLIEWKGAGKFSHVDAVLPTQDLLGARSDVIQGIPAGVRVRPPNYEPWAHVSRVTIPCTDAQQDAFMTFIQSKIGTAYNSVGILGILLDDAGVTNQSDLFCSQFLTEAVQASGVWSHPLGVPANTVDPNDLYKITSTYGEVAVLK